MSQSTTAGYGENLTPEQEREVETLGNQLARDVNGAVRAIRGRQPGTLLSKKPKDNFYAYIWRMARFHAGIDPRMPVMADFDLEIGFEDRLGFEVNYRTLSKMGLIKKFDQLVDDALDQLKLDKFGGARAWKGLLASFGRAQVKPLHYDVLRVARRNPKHAVQIVKSAGITAADFGGWEPGMVVQDGYDTGEVVSRTEDTGGNENEGSQVPPARDSLGNELNDKGKPVPSVERVAIDRSWAALARRVARAKELSTVKKKVAPHMWVLSKDSAGGFLITIGDPKKSSSQIKERFSDKDELKSWVRYEVGDRVSQDHVIDITGLNLVPDVYTQWFVDNVM